MCIRDRYSLIYAARILKNNQVEKTRKTIGYPRFLKLENLIGYNQKTMAITLTEVHTAMQMVMVTPGIRPYARCQYKAVAT